MDLMIDKINGIIKSDLVVSLLSLFVKVMSGVASYIMFIVFSNYLTASDYGKFSIIFSVIMLIGFISNAGNQTFIVKELSKFDVFEFDDYFSEKHNIIKYTLMTNLFAVFLGCFFYILVNYFYFHEISTSSYVFGCVLIFLFSFSQTTIGLLRVSGKTIFAVATRDLAWRVLTILVFILIIKFGIYSDELASSPIVALAISILPICILHAIKLWPIYTPYIKRNISVRMPKSWYNVTFGLSLIALISNADSYIYTIFAPMYIDKFQVGIIFSCLKTVELLNLFLMAITLVIGPQLSTYVAKNDIPRLQRKCNVAIVLQIIPIFFCMIFILIFSKELMSFFNTSYMDYSGVLVLFSIGMVINAMCGATGLLMQVGGMHWKHVLYQGGSVCFSLLSMNIWISMFDLYGVALSFIFSKLIWNVLAIRAIIGKYDVDPSICAFLVRRRRYISSIRSDIFNVK
jgi:O-antigen/teichoic acid export membrane protein